MLSPARNSDGSEHHDAEDVVRRALDISTGFRRLYLGFGLQTLGLDVGRADVLIHGEWRQRRVRADEGISGEPCFECDAELGAEPRLVEVRQVRIVCA